MRPADALIALADQLRPRGFTALYGSACNRFGVLSVVYGMTVWTDGLMLWWGSGMRKQAGPPLTLMGPRGCCSGRNRDCP